MSVSVRFTTHRIEATERSPGPGNGRYIRQYLVGMSVALLIVMVTAMPTLAGRGWCARDPIVRLGGVEYQILVSVPEENVAQVNGPLFFTISSPEDTTQDLLFTDEGFNGHGEKVVFKEHESENKHKVFLDVPHTGGIFPVLVEIIRDGHVITVVEGTSDKMLIDLPFTPSDDDDDDDDDDEDNDDDD